MKERVAPNGESGTLRTVLRSLQVLDLLKASDGLGFLELHRATGLPKATLTRILRTLIHAGWASQRLADNRYRASFHRPAMADWEQIKAQISEIATEHFHHLHRETIWPSDISICDGEKMVILESNRSASPLTINRNFMTLHPCMLWSAVGRAYLATCPVNERARILANLRQSTHPDDAAAADVQWVRQVLRQTRRQGYGLRAADYASPDQNEPGQLNAIAVPVLSKGRIIACLSLVWPNAVMREDQAVALNLARLKLAADRIGNSLSAHGIDKPVWLLSGHRQ